MGKYKHIFTFLLLISLGGLEAVTWGTNRFCLKGDFPAQVSSLEIGPYLLPLPHRSKIKTTNILVNSYQFFIQSESCYKFILSAFLSKKF